MLKDYAVSLTALALFFTGYTGILFWQNQKPAAEMSRISASVSASVSASASASVSSALTESLPENAPEAPKHFQAIEAGRSEP